MEFLYGELPSGAEQECRSHLESCPACRDQVRGWRETQGRLDTDRASLTPRIHPVGPTWVRPMLQWAAAAVLLLGIGFAVGRSKSPTREDLKNEIARVRDEVHSEIRGRFTDDLKTVAIAAAAGSTAETQRFLNEFITRFTTVRTEERREFLKALQGIEDRHALDYAELRAGLGQLARTTGSGFRQTESQINLIASQIPAESGSAAPSTTTVPDQSK
jgi:hypothetical protein